MHEGVASATVGQELPRAMATKSCLLPVFATTMMAKLFRSPFDGFDHDFVPEFSCNLIYQL